jgi:hypothetical protein
MIINLNLQYLRTVYRGSGLGDADPMVTMLVALEEANHHRAGDYLYFTPRVSYSII